MFGLPPSELTQRSAAFSLNSVRSGISLCCMLCLMLCLAVLISACSESKPPANQSAGKDANQSSGAARHYPEPPSPVTSATQILSGGWLLVGDGSDPQFDTIVVIRDGLIVGVGKRGTVDVPADSVGIDASGKWILPGTAQQLKTAFDQRVHDAPTQFTSAQLPAIVVGRSAELVLLNSNPLIDPQALKDVHAIVSQGQVELVKSDAS